MQGHVFSWCGPPMYNSCQPKSVVERWKKEGGWVWKRQTSFWPIKYYINLTYFMSWKRILLLCWLMFSWLKYYLFSEQKLNHSVKTLDGARASLKAIKSVEDNQGCMWRSCCIFFHWAPLPSFQSFCVCLNYLFESSLLFNKLSIVIILDPCLALPVLSR